MPDLEALEQSIGFQFTNPDLLQQALTHRSLLNEETDILDNERMEFLGDAILDLVVADMLYRLYPGIPEGKLTRLRAALVRNESLAILADEFHLGEFMKMGKGEDRSGGRERASNLGSGFEALVGAMHLDRGLDAVKTFLIPRLYRLLNYVLENNLHRDARSDLQELSQSELSITPRYRVVDSIGPEHDKEFMIEVMLNDNVIGRGVGSSKRSAAQSAARSALERLEQDGWPEIEPASQNESLPMPGRGDS